MTWILNFLGSGILKAFGNSILVPVLNAVRHAQDADLEKTKAAVGADKEVALRLLEGQIETNRAKVQMAQVYMGWWVTRWLVVGFAAPCMVHFAAIMLDSTFTFCSCIPKVPPPYDGYERDIILSFFILKPVDSAVKGFTSWLHR
jgi:hypothetical protein